MSTCLKTPEKTSSCDFCKGNFGADKDGKCIFCGFWSSKSKRSRVTPDTVSRGRVTPDTVNRRRKRLKFEDMSSNTKVQNEIPEELRFATYKSAEDAVYVPPDNLQTPFDEFDTLLDTAEHLDLAQIFAASDIDATDVDNINDVNKISFLDSALTPMNSEDMMFMMEHFVSDLNEYECNA